MAGAKKSKDLRESLERRGQIILVLQGGGALGAYQAGVYEALHEEGIEPDWVIGTSIGAIHAALIAGNEPKSRLGALRRFWDKVAADPLQDALSAMPWPVSGLPRLLTMLQGIPNFCTPNLPALLAPGWLAPEQASYYRTEPLRALLAELIDFGAIVRRMPRLTMGAANVRTSEMTYFDSREMPIGLDHVMASGALPPAFPMVRIGDDYFWDGGVLSNTPCEVIFDDNPRRDSMVFSVDIWQPHGSEPGSMSDVVSRELDLRYSSRLVSHIRRQQQIHRMRHIIAELGRNLPEEVRQSAAMRSLTSWGCLTRMHFVQLLAPTREGEDHFKGVDFSQKTILARWQAGLEDTRRALARRPWEKETDPMEGLILHEWQAG